MREDIDIRLLDYFYFSHSAVEKSNSLVVIQEEPENSTNKPQEELASESKEKH